MSLRLVLGVVLVGAFPLTAAAQSFSGLAGDSSESPLEVEADEGIEWRQDGQVFIARGNAQATRGRLTVRADVLKAYYRRTETGQTQVTQLNAEGNVEIASPHEKAVGKLGVYDVGKGVVVLSGGRVRLTTRTDLVTADRQLEYWESKRMAVARGNANAVRGERRLRADVLVAHLTDTEGQSRVHRVDAYDNIYIVTDQDTVTASRGAYDVETGLVTLTGKVTLARGQNQLSGCGAVVNLKTGISTLKSCPDAGRKGRVKGLLAPDRQIDVQ